jgi:hypothetical protein
VFFACSQGSARAKRAEWTQWVEVGSEGRELLAVIRESFFDPLDLKGEGSVVPGRQWGFMRNSSKLLKTPSSRCSKSPGLGSPRCTSLQTQLYALALLPSAPLLSVSSRLFWAYFSLPCLNALESRLQLPAL